MQRIKDALDNATTRGKNRGTLWASIQARRVIEFYYHGGYRTVEPYALGVTRHGHADNESLFCYQLSGFSDLNDAAGWKLYRISEMEEIKVSREQFSGDRPGYDPEDIRMVEVFCCVQPEKTAIKEVKEIPEPPETEPPPVYIAPRPPAPESLAHNELMRQFRLTHPLPIPELETYIFSGPRPQHPPERARWKNRHFAGASEGKVTSGGKPPEIYSTDTGVTLSQVCLCRYHDAVTGAPAPGLYSQVPARL